MKEGEVKVNGAVHKPAVEEYILDAHHRVAFHILNRNGKYVVEMPNKLSVFMHHGKVEVMTGYRYKGQMSGLCGDFNLEHKFDLQGPKHCLYDQKHYNTYYKSWVSEQTDCPKFADYKSEVASFQKTCVKAFEHDYMPERATHMYGK